MVLEEVNQETVVEPDAHSVENEFIFYVDNGPVMVNAAELLTRFGHAKKAILKAKGNSIPNAVAVANIMTEKLLKGNSEIQKISVDSETNNQLGRMLSMIEIILIKKSH